MSWSLGPFSIMCWNGRSWNRWGPALPDSLAPGEGQGCRVLLPSTWVFSTFVLRLSILVVGRGVTCRHSNDRQKKEAGKYISAVHSRLPFSSHGQDLGHMPSYKFIISRKKGPTLTGLDPPGLACGFGVGSFSTESHGEVMDTRRKPGLYPQRGKANGMQCWQQRQL